MEGRRRCAWGWGGEGGEGLKRPSPAFMGNNYSYRSCSQLAADCAWIARVLRITKSG